MPYGAIGLLVYFIVRAMRERERGPRTPRPLNVYTLPWFGLIWLLSLLAWGASVGVSAEVRGCGCLWVPTSAWMVFLIVPWPVTRFILIPLRCYRLAWHFSLLSRITWERDHRGAAALTATLAVLRQRPPSPAALDWIERRLEQRYRLRGAGIVAMGFLALARGDAERARTLLEGIEDVDPRAMPPTAARLAGEWLAADAASRGKWRRVRWLSRRGPHGRSRLTRFLGLVAARLTGAPPVPGKFKLLLAWIFTPRRLRTRSILARAWDAADAPLEPPAAVSAEPPPSPAPMRFNAENTRRRSGLRRAVRLHAEMLGREVVHKKQLQQLGDAWRTALPGREIRRWAAERSLALSATIGEGALDDVERTVRADLEAMLRRAGCPLGRLLRDAGPLGRAAREVRGKMLSEIELACRALSARVTEKRALPAMGEWREWQALRESCERAFRQGGEGLRRLAYPSLHQSVTNFAVWLFNVRKETSIANAIFRWLLKQARAVEDRNAISLQTKNVHCGA